MRFEQAITAGFRNYAEFGGRARRPEFCWWGLFTTLVSAALSALPAWPMMSLSWHGSFQPGNGLAGVWSIAVLLPTLGLTVRRLRDAGYGWGHLFWLLLPLAGLIVLIVLCAQPSGPVAPSAADPTRPSGMQSTTAGGEGAGR
jgi:uncharacterized membrane protein YhaH (DUF805 family)